jgi:hypothetical protein
MAITVNGVTATVYLGEDGGSGGLEESWPEGQPAKVVVYYKVPWANRYAFMSGLRGGISAGAVILPHAYPHSPSLTCIGIGTIRNLKPKISSSGLVDYQWAIVPAEYGVPRFDTASVVVGGGGGGGGSGNGGNIDPSGKAFTNTTWNVTTEMFTPPVGSYYWEGGPADGSIVAPSDATLGLFRSRIEFTIRRTWLPSPRLHDAIRFVGSVNTAPIRIADHTFNRGTLWLAGISGGMERTESIDGQSGEISYTIVGSGTVWNAEGTVGTQVEWNQYMGAGGNWYYVNTAADGTGARPYPYTDYWDQLP